MTRLKSLLALALAAGLMVGCSDSGGGSVGSGSGGGEATSMSFTGLVGEVLANDGEGAEPMGMNEREVTFNDQNDETAFDAHLNP